MLNINVEERKLDLKSAQLFLAGALDHGIKLGKERLNMLNKRNFSENKRNTIRIE